jgi:cytochrome c
MFLLRHGAGLLLATILLSGNAMASGDRTIAQSEKPDVPKGPRLVLPIVDSAKGRKLFVNKGCVVCHSVNGVGGKAAPALDADPVQDYVDVFEFAARMWRGAPNMIVLQNLEMGYQLYLTGEELAHLSAFANDPKAQLALSKDDIPDLVRDWIDDVMTGKLEDALERLQEFSE